MLKSASCILSVRGLFKIQVLEDGNKQQQIYEEVKDIGELRQKIKIQKTEIQKHLKQKLANFWLNSLV